MKYRAPLFLLAALAVTGWAAPAMAQERAETTLIHRPSPTPDPKGASSPAAPGVKKPLTATLSKDEKGKAATTVFAPSDPKIYLQWNDETGQKGDKIRVVWYAEDTGGVMAKNKKINETAQTLTGPNQPGSSFLTGPASGFPVGTYRVDLYDGAKVSKSVRFTVKK